MDESVIFSKLNTLSDYLKIIYNTQKSHAYLLLNEDSITSKLVSKLFTLFFVCENKINEKPCFTCSSCQKVLHNTAVDVFNYPKKASILVEDIKEIVSSSQSKPIDFSYKIYILNDIHEANISAQNKLLKILEEPPHNVIFILTAPSEKSLLPTIVSRAKTIPIIRSKDNELVNIVELEEENAKKANIAVEAAQGNLGKALANIKNEVYFTIYDFCLNLIFKMNHSKFVLEYASIMEKNKKFLDIYLELLSEFFRDILVIKQGLEQTVVHKSIINNLQKISSEYSVLAILKILEKIENAKKMMIFNANSTSIIDTLLLSILEVKYKWKNK